MKILFLDLDGTVRKTKSGATFINDPYDQELIVGVEGAIARYKGWKIFGITNQGGVGAGFKTLNDCILEQAETMRLLPQIQSVCFCPDDGKTMYMVKSCTHKVTKDSIGGDVGNFCKPSPGMVLYVFNTFKKIGFMEEDISWKFDKCLFVGDRPEDQQTANNTNIPFMWAEEWRNGKHHLHI